MVAGEQAETAVLDAAESTGFDHAFRVARQSEESRHWSCEMNSYRHFQKDSVHLQAQEDPARKPEGTPRSPVVMTLEFTGEKHRDRPNRSSQLFQQWVLATLSGAVIGSLLASLWTWLSLLPRGFINPIGAIFIRLGMCSSSGDETGCWLIGALLEVAIALAMSLGVAQQIVLKPRLSRRRWWAFFTIYGWTGTLISLLALAVVQTLSEALVVVPVIMTLTFSGIMGYQQGTLLRPYSPHWYWWPIAHTLWALGAAILIGINGAISQIWDTSIGGLFLCLAISLIAYAVITGYLLARMIGASPTEGS